MSCVQHQYRNIPDLHGLISMPRQAWKLTPRDLRISTRHALVPKSLDMKNDRHIQDGVRITLPSPSPLFTILRPYWSTYNYVTWKNASRVIRIKAPEFFKKLESMPNIKAVFINVDLNALGNREKDSKIRARIDSETTEALDVYAHSDVKYFSLTWDHMKQIQQMTKLPIVLKGVLNKNDVLKAAEAGLAGALISNHGGRQLDFAMPPIEILAESKQLLREKGLDKNFELFIDGGIRRGSDIIKALCLGASGVGLGRPFLYSLASYGEEGVQKAIQILKTEMIRDMKLLGVSSISELNEDMVDITSLKYKGLQTRDHLYDQNYTPMPDPPFRKE
ncbi:hypothetical protein KL908_004027 [Ogataea polymorpha]|nr:hypothetical protein KL908_004027 [Ogataea polymorpha]